MNFACRFPFFLPMWPLPGFKFIVGLAAIAGVVFSIVMLIDCLKRSQSGFPNPITKNGEYDKLIWVIAIVASLWFYFLGAIIYFFVVRKSRPESSE